jgi:hypothetical protein
LKESSHIAQEAPKKGRQKMERTKEGKGREGNEPSALRQRPRHWHHHSPKSGHMLQGKEWKEGRKEWKGGMEGGNGRN